MERLVAAVKSTRDRMAWPAGPPPLLVKIAPDLTPAEMRDIAVSRFWQAFRYFSTRRQCSL